MTLRVPKQKCLGTRLDYLVKEEKMKEREPNYMDYYVEESYGFTPQYWKPEFYDMGILADWMTYQEPLLLCF